MEGRRVRTLDLGGTGDNSGPGLEGSLDCGGKGGKG